MKLTVADLKLGQRWVSEEISFKVLAITDDRLLLEWSDHKEPPKWIDKTSQKFMYDYKLDETYCVSETLKRYGDG